MTTVARTGPLIRASGKGHVAPAVPPSTAGCQCLTACQHPLRTSRGSDGSDGSDGSEEVSERPFYSLTVWKTATVFVSIPSPLTSGGNAQMFTAKEKLRNPSGTHLCSSLWLLPVDEESKPRCRIRGGSESPGSLEEAPHRTGHFTAAHTPKHS